jgi:hypothetical protein
MRRLAFFVLLAVFSGCTCSRSSLPSSALEAGVPPPSATAQPAFVAPEGAPRYSKPIAAARAGGGAVLVAGLVAAEKAIVVSRVESASGKATFRTSALKNVGWTADAELRAYPADGGAAVVWRGLRDGKMVRQMILVGKEGAVEGDPFDVGPATCATDDGVAWTERGSNGKTRVLLRAWHASGPREVASVGADREPVVVCAAHRVFALGQGDDDLVLSVGDAEASSPKTLLGAGELGLDDDRELEELTVGDELALFRVASNGVVAIRETKSGAPTSWHKLNTTIPADDDLVAVDGDADAIVAVTTRDMPGACTGDAGGTGTGTGVRGLRVARSGTETSVELAPAECGKDVGPFWIGEAGSALVVAWAERVPKTGATSAPIAGLAYRVFAGPTPGAMLHVARPADALVDAGCDETKCYAVALARAPGTTEMEPELATVLAYP